MPETTTTLTTGATPRPRLRGVHLVAQAQDHDEPGGGEHERRDEHGDSSSRRAPLRPEHRDERDRDERLEPVRHDPQARPPDGDGKRLRPPECEVDRGGEEDDAGGGHGTVVLRPNTRSTSHGIATKNAGTATSISAPAHLV